MPQSIIDFNNYFHLRTLSDIHLHGNLILASGFRSTLFETIIY